MDPLRLAFPFTGRWIALNSPADRVPSHGTELFGSTYAIDFVAVDVERGRSAPWHRQALLGVEPPDRFVGFGAPILAPITGVVVVVHDGEPDHEARRSLFSLIRYLSTQRTRVARGPAGVAGNHVVIGATVDGPFVLLAHLRTGSVSVRVGDRVRVGQVIAACGNSGNSTQPHVHVQATDSLDWTSARGIPLAFTGVLPSDDRVWLPRNRSPFTVPSGDGRGQSAAGSTG